MMAFVRSAAAAVITAMLVREAAAAATDARLPPIAGSLSSPWSRSAGEEVPFDGMLASAPWTRDTEVSQRVVHRPAQSRFCPKPQNIAGFVLDR